MKRNILISLLCLLFLFKIHSNNFKIKGLNNDIYNKLCGVWFVGNSDYDLVVHKYSWGYSKDSVNMSVIIDFGSEYSYYDVDNGIGALKIIEIKVLKNDLYEFTLDTKGTEIEKESNLVKIKYINDKKIEIIKAPIFFRTGILYKIDGPNIPFTDFYSPKVNLRLRERPNLESKTIRILEKGEKVVIIIKSRDEVIIYGIKGKWVEIESVEKQDKGWCFDGYLDEWTDEVKK